MPRCILIVDDDPVAIELAKRTIQTKGYEVLTAQDGQEALDGLKIEAGPDFVRCANAQDGWVYVYHEKKQ